MKRATSVICIIFAVIMIIAAIISFEASSILMKIGYVVFAVFFLAIGLLGIINRKS